MPSLRTLKDLEREGLVAPDPRLEQAADGMAIGLTEEMLARIDRRDLAHDPVARQFLPDVRELEIAPEEIADPIGDEARSPIKGIVHRYPDRVLLKLVHVCAVYCRFCFRRTMVGPGKRKTLSPAALDAALEYIRTHPEVWEVILTGGDPLMLSPARLGGVMNALGAIGHVKVVRLHTRIPAVAPKRVTRALVDALRAPGKATYVVLHANHARELNRAAVAACGRLIDAGIPMLSQSVLLRGVNDTAVALGELMRALVEARIKPYYLHHADLAPGTAHLRTSIAEGRALLQQLQGAYSGLCQPQYVLDIPGGHGKSPIGPEYLSPVADGTYRIRDFRGREHRYRDTKRK